MEWLTLDIDTLKHPHFLWLLIPAVLLLAAEWVVRPQGAAVASTGEVMARVRGQLNSVSHKIPSVLRFLALVLLIFALARPLTGMRPVIESAEVRDIMLTLDVSGSMTAIADVIQNRPLDRLDVTKLAVIDFIANRKIDETDRFGTDRLGLIAYASWAWIQTPLTLDYGLLEYELGGLEIDTLMEPNKHNQTAIGEAIALSVSNLNKSPAQSKVIVLLTDGNNNAGKIDPLTAADLAKRYGIRVYTIGAGAPDVRNQRARQNPIDETTLKKIAEATGGKYYRATNLNSLQEAYQEINDLETTEIETGMYYEYDEGFFPFAVLGGSVMVMSLMLRRKWFEVLP
jgi:Ca-activated chloride channel family protein